MDSESRGDFRDLIDSWSYLSANIMKGNMS